MLRFPLFPKAVYDCKCSVCGKDIHFQYSINEDSKEPLYCRECFRKSNPKAPNMEMLGRGHPHRSYGGKDESWPWVQSPYDFPAHRTFGWQRPMKD